MNKQIHFLAIFLLASFFVSAQYKLVNDKSTMTIDGTSNLHDWTETVKTMSGSMAAQVSGTTIQTISSLKLTVLVASIKSDHSAMDKNTYKALNQTKYPNITYDLQSIAIAGEKATLEGNLTIAGVTRKVKFTTGYKVSGNSITLNGQYTFKMTDFKIDPPTALMGTMTTGDQITVKFNVLFNK